MQLKKVPAILLPKQISHSKIDQVMMQRLGKMVPYKCNWGGPQNQELVGIEYVFEEGGEIPEVEIHQAFGAARLEKDEPDEFEAHRKEKAAKADEEAEVRALAQERIQARKIVDMGRRR